MVGAPTHWVLEIFSKTVVSMAKNLMNNYRSNVPPTVKVRMHCKHYNPCL